ncbi:MAG: hypothetical protein ABIQ44_06345 [Chloroflexia bacterium]
MLTTMYAIYQIARDVDRERANDAKRSWLLSKARKAIKSDKNRGK